MTRKRCFSVALSAIFLVSAIGVTGWGCSGGNNTTVKCTRDEDCPDGQQCVSGNCQLPGDPGPKTCSSTSECPIGYECVDGICKPYGDEEPDAGAEDGGDEATGDGDEVIADQPGDEGADEDTRDFSHLNFTVAVRRGGTSGPASQCVINVKPGVNEGPVLPDVTLAGGYTLSGTVSDGAAVAGADVVLLADRPACVPAATQTDGGGGYTFYLPGGNYHLQVTKPSGLVAHERVNNFSSNTNVNISMPATADLTGGPLTADGSDLNGWTVMAWYVSGQFGGKLAHAGVITGPPNNAVTGMFTIPLPESTTFDLLGKPPSGDNTHPLQVLYEGVDTGSVLMAQPVTAGATLSGTISTSGGTGAPGCGVSLINTVDPRLVAEGESVTNGAYQALVKAAKRWKVTVTPSGAAFNTGALLYAHPDLFIPTDQQADIELAEGEQVVFSGKLVDTGGSPVAGAEVRLLISQAFLEEGDYSLCDTEWVESGADGTFEITCNLAP